MIIAATDDIAADLRAVDPATGEEIRDVTLVDSCRGELTVLRRDEAGHLVENEEGSAFADVVVRRPFRIERRSTGEIICEAA